MTETFERIIVDANNRIVRAEGTQALILMQDKDELIPDGAAQGSQCYITDGPGVAVCNRNGVWTAGNGKQATAGQPWSDLL
ncbi:MAG: hypothetical protein IJ960_00950 [Oscillospiraceae bacterium]|nr:hypothetical protein [Oscillospiraceae bacterium]